MKRNVEIDKRLVIKKEIKNWIRKRILETVDKRYSPVAQLVEQLTVNQLVRGSSPRGGAIQKKRALWPPGQRAFSFVGKEFRQ
jgi:hypothetical protein